MKMPAAFLLRYQEFCLPDETPDVCCGTKTFTKVRTEQPDVSAAALCVLPRASFSGGTITKASIGRETGGQDQYRSVVLMRIFVRTPKTKIKGDYADFATGETTILTIPRPSLFPVAQTKTVTAVKAEMDGNAPKWTFLHVIPKCS